MVNNFFYYYLQRNDFNTDFEKCIETFFAQLRRMLHQNNFRAHNGLQFL